MGFGDYLDAAIRIIEKFDRLVRPIFWAGLAALLSSIAINWWYPDLYFAIKNYISGATVASGCIVGLIVIVWLSKKIGGGIRWFLWRPMSRFKRLSDREKYMALGILSRDSRRLELPPDDVNVINLAKKQVIRRTYQGKKSFEIEEEFWRKLKPMTKKLSGTLKANWRESEIKGFNSPREFFEENN